MENIVRWFLRRVAASVRPAATVLAGGFIYLSTSCAQDDAMAEAYASNDSLLALDVAMDGVRTRLQTFRKLNPAEAVGAIVCVGVTDVAFAPTQERQERFDWWYRDGTYTYPPNLEDHSTWPGIRVTLTTIADCKSRRQQLLNQFPTQTLHEYTVVIAGEEVVRRIKESNPGLVARIMMSAVPSSDRGDIKYLIATIDRSQLDTTIVALGEREGILAVIGGIIIGM